MAKIYLSGSITGIENLNIEAFREAEEILKKKGHKVMVPHDLFEGYDTEGWEHWQFMRVCVMGLASCDMVVTLLAWDKSKGAKQEIDIARILLMPVEPITKFL